MLPRASACNAIATGRLVFVCLPGVFAAGFGPLFFGDRGIGANLGEALGGHMGHDGHPIIRCNYAQEGFPFLTVRGTALNTPHFKHTATHFVKVYSFSVDWFRLSPRVAFMAPYPLRIFLIFGISMLSLGYPRGLRNLLMPAGYVSC